MYSTVNCHGRLLDLRLPHVMGILNVTPDSFYAASRTADEEAIVARVHQIAAEGATIIDVGACSTRPGSTPVDESEEMSRLRLALPLVRREAPGLFISVDTFRPDVARMAVDEYGADLINDVGGPADAPPPERPVLPPLASALRAPNVPYILTSPYPTLRSSLLFFSHCLSELHGRGLKDIILDPGFGFGKSASQSHALLARMECLQSLAHPLLVGLSRKSMVWRPLGVDASESLAGTTALHAIALMKGANILRVHDVRDAVHTVKLFCQMTSGVGDC